MATGQVPDPDSPDPDSLRLELQEAIATYRHWLSQVTQITGFIIAGTTILVGYGLTRKDAAILLIATPAPMLILLEYLLVESIAVPLAILILRLERRLCIREDSLGITFIEAYLRAKTRDSGSIKDLNDEEVRERLRRSRFWAPVPIVFYVSTLGLIALFVLSVTVFNYRFM